jgi:hypothetical protein
MGLRYYPLPEEQTEETQQPRFSEAADYTYEVKGWKPIPVRDFEFKKVYFVDGVRYTHAKVGVAEDENFDTIGYGIFISMAAGVCKVEKDRLGRYDYAVLHPRTGRFFVHTLKDALLPSEFRFGVGNGEVVFKTIEAVDLSVGAALLLRKLEKEVVKKLWSGGFDGFTLMDGTVKTRRFVPDAAHVVKKSNVFYLSGDHRRILGFLRAGERTPAFVFEEPTDPETPEGGKKILKKVGIYARLPGWGGDPLSHLVRIELPFDERANPREVVETLEKAAALSMRFANHPLMDRRSPQNLTAVAFLERQLRTYLGKNKLLRSLIYAALGVA